MIMSSALRDAGSLARLFRLHKGPVFLDGHRRHATLEWTGLRQVAVAFCVKDPWKVPYIARRRAKQLGFQVPKARPPQEWGRSWGPTY